MEGKPQIGTNRHKSEDEVCEDKCGFVVNSRVEHVERVEDLEMGFHPIPRIRTNHKPFNLFVQNTVEYQMIRKRLGSGAKPQLKKSSLLLCLSASLR